MKSSIKHGLRLDSVYKNVGFDPIKDFSLITVVGAVPNVLVVHPNFPAKTLNEFIALIDVLSGQAPIAFASLPSALKH
jgi:tripartite-type tricarboxylate transporter receptor subunit TctC